MLVLGLTTGSAIANMSSPWEPGDPVGEPIGIFRQLSIVQETLTLDLRSLVSQKKGRVMAAYLIRNNGSQATVDLLFISPGIQTGNVTVDGTKVASNKVSQPTVPPEWKKPITMPKMGNRSRALGFGGTVNLYNLYHNNNDGISFQAILPTGEHRLQISYDVQPGEENGDGKIYRQYLIGYFLAPARSWARFGQLDIEVNLPSGWEVATSLPMKRTNDNFRATFTGIPADGLAVIASPPLYPLSSGLSILLRVAGWGGGLIGSWRLGLEAGRFARLRGLGGCLGLCATAALMPVGSIIFVLPTLLGEWLSWSVLNNGHLSPIWEYGHNLIVFLLMFLGLWVSGVATAVAMTEQLYLSKLR